MPDDFSTYDQWKTIWPDGPGRPLAPVRVGVDRRTGKVLIGLPHVEQSLETIWSTRFHERILRQWAGSFVLHLLGKNTVASTFTSFYWAIGAAIDLWEPGARFRRVRVRRRADGRDLTSAEELRRGEARLVPEWDYMPRGHLGDKTVERTHAGGLVPGGAQIWDRTETGP